MKKKALIIGAGPAGLTAAYFLGQMGHKVTIYERQKALGGMLRYGIPNYRFPKDRLDEDAQGIEKLRSVEVDLRIEERLVAAQRGEWLRLKRRHEPEKTEADDIERRGDVARAGGTPVLVQAADVLERVLYGSRKHSLKTDKGLEACGAHPPGPGRKPPLVNL